MWKKLKRSGGNKFSSKGGGALKYRVLLQKDPDNLSALTKLGIIYFETDENEKACQLLRKAKSLQTPDTATGKFWRTLGRALMKRWHASYERGGGISEDAKDAVEAFEAALKYFENATNPNVYVELGKAYEAYGAFEGAMQVYANIVMSFPTWDNLNRAVFCAAVLSLHPTILNLDESKRYFENIMLDPPKPFNENLLLFQLARVYQLMGKRKLARDAFTEVFKRSDQVGQLGHRDVAGWANDMRMWISKGDFHVQNKDYILAVDAFQQGLRCEKTPSSAHLCKCALAMKTIGEDDAALENMKRAYELDDTYNLKYRNALLKWDNDNWKDQFDMENKGATEMQKIVRGCWGRRKGLKFMVIEREIRRRRFHGALGFQRLWRGVLGRIFAKKEAIRFKRYKKLVSRSLKRLQMKTQLFALKQLHRRVKEIQKERENARKRRAERIRRRNLKRMQQRKVLAALYGWYNNVQGIIEERWRHRNHMASSIALFYRFILWRIDRRERERKIRWSLNRMGKRWIEEGFRAWDEFRLFSICIKIQKRRTAHRIKKETFRVLCRFTLWNIARKKRLQEKRRLRNIRFRNDVQELVGNYDPLLVVGRHHNVKSLTTMKAWARKIRIEERKLQDRARHCQQTLNFQGRLALQAGCLRGIIPRLPKVGESQLRVLKREYEMSIRLVEEKRVLPALNVQKARRKHMKFEEEKAPPSMFHNVLWPFNTKTVKLKRLTGYHLSELHSLRKEREKIKLSNFQVGPGPSTPKWDNPRQKGLLPGILTVDNAEMKIKEHVHNPLALRQQREEAKREQKEQDNMAMAEVESRMNDATIDNAERAQDIVRFAKCVDVGGPMEEQLFCLAVLPGQLYCQIVFRAACRIQLWMLICHPARKIRHERAAKMIQYTWWDSLDRADAKRELYIRRVIRRMGGERKRRTLCAWRLAVTRQKNVKLLMKKIVFRHAVRALRNWNHYTVTETERRKIVLQKALQRIRLHCAENCFDIWLAFTLQRMKIKTFVRRQLMSGKRQWFNVFYDCIRISQNNRRCEYSARRIQAVVRGHNARLMVERKREYEHNAVLLLQRNARGLIGRKIVQILRRKALKRQTIETRKAERNRNKPNNVIHMDLLQMRRKEILAQLQLIEKLKTGGDR